MEATVITLHGRAVVVLERTDSILVTARARRFVWDTAQGDGHLMDISPGTRLQVRDIDAAEGGAVEILIDGQWEVERTTTHLIHAKGTPAYQALEEADLDEEFLLP